MNFLPKLASGRLVAAVASSAAAQVPVPKDATDVTRVANHTLLSALPMTDKRAFEDATRGLIEAFGDQVVMHESGTRPAWSLKGYEFLAREDAPDTVNPALWRHSRVNMANGLYKVSDRIYQLRGVDLSNMTVIEGDTGLIVIDPLTSNGNGEGGTRDVLQTSADEAGARRDLHPQPCRPLRRCARRRPRRGRGQRQGQDHRSRRLHGRGRRRNVIAGNAMSRRALYQFGMLLPRGEKGQVDAGLGKAVPLGTITLIAPTQLIEKPVETHRIDGVDIVFELTPGAQAPAEMIMYYPQFRVLNMAEIATQNFHNLLPMRGAQVRDPLAWSKYIGGALRRYGTTSDVLIAQHNWPVWGSANVQTFLKVQRDSYKFVHDQTLRLMNQGHVGAEIAETMKLPPSLAQDWSTDAFYGDLKHK